MYYMLTTQQENIWNLQTYYEGTPISNISGILHFKEYLDIEILKKAINMYVKYQEGARIRFFKVGSLVQQYVTDYKPFDVSVMRFDNLSEMHKYAESEARILYYFGNSEETSEMMCRFTIYETDDNCGIIIHMNHLISDAWTLSLFCQTVIKYYQMLVKGREVNIETVSYIDYIQKEKHYLSSVKFQQDAIYWNERFAKGPVRKRIKPEGKEECGICSMRLTQKIPKEHSTRIRDICDQNGYSPAVFFESVIFVYLNQINERGKETIIGVPVLNRTGKDKQIAGMFVSTMPLGITVESTDTMLQVCKKVSTSHFELFRHQRFPYSTILRNVRQAHGFEGNLYDVIVSYQNAVVGETDGLEYETEWLFNGCSEVSMAFHIDDRDESGCFTINMDMQEELFSKEEANWLLQRLLFMAGIAAKNGDITVGKMPLMSEKEYEVVLNKFNDTKVPYDSSLCIHEVFEQQVLLHGEKAAIICEDILITYKKLSVMSDKLATILRQQGIRRGDIVPVISTRSSYIIVAMLGIMKAGGAYLPVDCQYPNDRIKYMLEEAGTQFILCCGEKSRKICETLRLDILSLEDISYENIAAQKVKNENGPEDIAYVIFTSGSTGKPKGTMLKHKGLVNFCLDDGRNCGFQHTVCQDCNTILAIGAFSFDISLVEIFLPLLNGLTVSLATDEQVNKADYLAKMIVEERIDIIHTTPTRLAFYMESQAFVEAMSKLKVILVAGESLSQELHSRILKATAAKLFNGYGPTETTIGCGFSRMDQKKSVTIGKPIANVQIYIVNQEDQICPIGVAGELCVSGDGVGAGYLNRPGLTAEKFISNPFSTEKNGHGKMLYRTGDLARWRDDGEIEFLGRIDTQVKIKGLRVELEEIESKLMAYPDVEFCVVADKTDEKGRQILVGYYTSEKLLQEQKLRKYLLEFLPKYMVPNYFMKLNHIPINASGKTDRKNLPMPDLSNRVTEYIPPENELEKNICSLYGQVLGIEQIGRTDHFFDLGGDSLAAMTLVSKLSDFYGEISLQWIFEKPVVKDFAELLEMYSNVGQEIKEDGKNGDYIKKCHSKYMQYRKFLRQQQTILQPSILKEPSVEKVDRSGIILTGATGFLGAHILKELLEPNENPIEVYCLVRAENDLDARKRLYQVMENYFDRTVADLVSDDYRVHVIACDITDFPIESIKEALKRYSSVITQIVHAAALVKHYGVYETFYHINVEGTKNMLFVAKDLDAEFLYISTESVGGLYVEEKETARSSNTVRKFTENDLYIGQNLDNVYIRSKFEAECCVLDYMLAGGQARIFRIGNLTNRYCDGRFQSNYTENAFLRRIYTFLSLGVYPDILDNILIEFSPVDETARAIIALAFQGAKLKQCIYHVSHSKAMTYKHFASKLHAIGKKLCSIPVNEFMALLLQGNISHDYVKNDLHAMKRMSAYIPVIPVNDKTNAYLKEIGFSWKEIDKKYLKLYTEYIENLKL